MTVFLKVRSSSKDGVVEKRLINVDDIGAMRPAPAHCDPARTCISLRSQPDYPVWSVETIGDLEKALLHLGCDMAPHGTGE